MNTLRVSATSARNRFFELLNQVMLGTQVIIERDKKEVAVLVPKSKKTDWNAFRKASKAAYGILKDYSIDEIAPVRKRNAWKGFGEWDKDIKFAKKK
ncbi:type II toxin-antitoxin system prevent-host-death family antitoxin [Candidatus Curtissbacteria bacterium]|nr:type II toxin-antitoxin system prevent-host-death family antitoxin [Candidatus Curtissbacteria bacterium]